MIDVLIFKPLINLGYREYSFHHPIYVFSDSNDSKIMFDFSDFIVDKYWCDLSEPFSFSELQVCYNILKSYKEVNHD